MHSEHQPAETHPIINGGTYTNKVTGEQGVIMGVVRNKTTGNLEGQMYGFHRGPMPTVMVENTFGFVQWELTSAPGKPVATGLITSHKRKRKAEAEALEAAKTAAA